MTIVGMDIHRSFAQAAILEDGTIIGQLRCRSTIRLLPSKTLSPEDEVVIEVTGSSRRSSLRPHIERVAVANPRLVRPIAYAQVKTDKIDAGVCCSCCGHVVNAPALSTMSTGFAACIRSRQTAIGVR